MRQLINSTYVTLDGVIEDPGERGRSGLDGRRTASTRTEVIR